MSDIVVRPLRLDEAEAYLELRKATEAESDYLLYEAGERTTSVEAMGRLVDDILSEPNSTILVACDGDDDGAGSRLVGFLAARGGTARHNRHAAEIVIAIRDGFRGRGVGTALFRAVEAWAGTVGVSRLGLGHIDRNETAHALYVRMGFREEGRKKSAFLLSDGYADEILMAKLLGASD